MTDKNVQLKSLDGVLLYPKTKGAVVLNNAGKDLGGVEENAQVNVIESISYDSSALSINNKDVALPVFSFHKVVSTDADYSSEYAAQYYLTKDGVKVGDMINLAKDQVLNNVELKECTVANVPVTGYNVGDLYFEFTFANKSTPIYLAAKDLVDAYTSGDGIDITNNVIKVDLTGYSKAGSKAAIAASDTLNAALGKLEYKADNAVEKNADITGATKCKITYDAKGLVTAGADLDVADIPNLPASKVNLMTGYSKAATAAAIAATDTLNEAIGKLEKTVDGKLTANAEITGATKCKITYDAKGLVTAGADLAASDIPALDSSKITTLGSYAKASTAAAIETTDTLDQALGKLEKGLDGKQATITGAATSVVSDDLTASMVLVSDANGKIAASSIPASTLLITYEELS